MKRLAGFSYQVKVPLALTLAIIITEFVLGVTLVYFAYTGYLVDLKNNAHTFTNIVSKSVRESLTQDDLWRTFETIRVPLDANGTSTGLTDILILNNKGNTYVASEPKRFVVSQPLNELPEKVQRIYTVLSQSSDDFHFDFSGFFSSLPAVAGKVIQSDDGGIIGYAIVLYNTSVLRERIFGLVLRATLISVPGLIILMIFGWFWGGRIAAPLRSLATAMETVGTNTLPEIRKSLDLSGDDEISQLSKKFDNMLEQLESKKLLEQEIVVTERLAAVGRVSAGVAHEINNPLGGMINALNTLEKHGQPDELTNKTIGLLSRGLNQIKSTVAALLVEARLDSMSMGPEDWDDLRTLVTPEIAAKNAKLVWSVSIRYPLALPSHLLRQLCLNLLINARNAVEHNGSVGFSADNQGEVLTIEVSNSGKFIPEDDLSHLFEPYWFARKTEKGKSYGLGLWVTYQIVSQLKGTIEVSSEEGYTCFKVVLPLNATEFKT